KVTVDHRAHVAPLGQAAVEAGVSIGVLVDVDIGMGRCGVASAPKGLSFARCVAGTRGLPFDRIMGYEGHTRPPAHPFDKREAIRNAIGRLTEGRVRLEEAGLACRIVSAGGSGSYQITSQLPGVTELQAGGGIFACRYYTEFCRVEGHQPAITVRATVVSTP